LHREWEEGASVLRKFLIAVAMTPVVSGLVALGLILSQWPEADPRRAAGAEATHEVTGDRLPPLETYRARDGAMLGYRTFQPSDPSQDAPIVIMLHGAGGHGGWMAPLASGVAERSNAIVIAPDLRGHGPTPARRGDVDYIGQLEDDVADLVGHLAPQDREIILLGHSAGGGLTIRLAGGAHSTLVDRAVLVAPFLQHDAPTALAADPDGWARPLVRRIAGLWMLNSVGISLLNHLTVVEFRFPEDVLNSPASALATRHYSYRLQFSLSPRRDWQKDVAGLPLYLLVAGAADTTFRADAYEPTLRPIAPHGDFVVLDGAGHADILDDMRLVNVVSNFIAGVD
jgi:alpha-beta hydrolase superfamily lysophospholipase